MGQKIRICRPTFRDEVITPSSRAIADKVSCTGFGAAGGSLTATERDFFGSSHKCKDKRERFASRQIKMVATGAPSLEQSGQQEDDRRRTRSRAAVARQVWEHPSIRVCITNVCVYTGRHLLLKSGHRPETRDGPARKRTHEGHDPRGRAVRGLK